ncbi:TonB-dependent siderophore receptor [[Mannheimia] succiniciproducens]|uniref:CirA protein n=1 Tax=Mannheimia succiniciproducens (strain KCTC 0769BP / MBEL55E) TaxID=221988 RepID=Q65SY8_MANSM|nr:TonB-dependent siderophore receptor [[Mannheimia] succiniciproducens]AAU37922.1 CirA protein [[Mannheimia] succiniciproducens MBEL55E]
MNFKFNLIYTALFSGLAFSSYATETNQEVNTELEQINVATELEKAKAAGNKQKDIVNLSLLGRQPAFTSPISVVNYDEKAFEDKQPRNVVDAIAKTDASVMNFGGETNTLSGIYVRGLQLDARQISVNGLAGLYSTYNSPTAAVSSAQLIKGASTATTGMDPEGSAGSAMNIETKHATDNPINKIGFGWFSNNRLQESFDFGRRFGENNAWGVRVNGKYRDGDTARHGYDEINKEFAVAADYRGDKFRAAIDYMYAKRATNGGRARVQDIQNLDFAMPKAPDGKINLIPSWSGQTTEDQTVMGTFEYDLPYNMMLSGGLGHMESKYYGAFGQIRMTNTEGDYSIRQMRAIDYRIRTTSANLKLQGELETGSLYHMWNTSFDFVQRQRDFDQSPVLSNFSTNIYNPVFPSVTAYSALQQSTDEKSRSYSWALADTVGFFDNSLRLTLGGRFQWIKQHNYKNDSKGDKNRFSPMVTLAYVPNPDLVFYGNYLEDLEPGYVDEDGNMAKPVVSRQIELGVRKNWGDLFTTTASIYQIRRPGIVTTNLAKNNADFTVGEEQGEERNRGIEFNIYASLFNNTVRPSLGITYNKGELIDYSTYAGAIKTGTQVASPRIISKANIDWDTPFIENLTLNAALQYYGKSYQDIDKKYKLPAYTTVDLGAKYLIKLNETQTLTLRAAVENVFDKNYWQVQRGKYDRSFAVVGMPRTYWLTAEYTF